MKEINDNFKTVSRFLELYINEMERTNVARAMNALENDIKSDKKIN
jgi:hypothetical protein